MKLFLNSIDAYQHIMNNMGSGNEKIINDTLHYGVGETAYVYLEDALAAGLDSKHYYNGNNPLFVHLTNDGLKLFLDAQPTLIQE